MEKIQKIDLAVYRLLRFIAARVSPRAGSQWTSSANATKKEQKRKKEEDLGGKNRSQTSHAFSSPHRKARHEPERGSYMGLKKQK